MDTDDEKEPTAKGDTTASDRHIDGTTCMYIKYVTIYIFVSRNDSSAKK